MIEPQVPGYWLDVKVRRLDSQEMWEERLWSRSPLGFDLHMGSSAVLDEATMVAYAKVEDHFGEELDEEWFLGLTEENFVVRTENPYVTPEMAAAEPFDL